MTTNTNQNWSLRGWYGPPAIWINLFVFALIFELLGVVLNIASQSMVDKQTQAQSDLNTAGVVIVKIAAIAVVALFWWGLPILSTWRRWANAGKKQKNYIFWTCIQGGFVFLRGLALAYSLLMFPAVINSTTGITGALAGTQQLYFIFIGGILLGGVSFLLWLSNTIMIPRREKQPIEHSNADTGVVPNS